VQKEIMMSSIQLDAIFPFLFFESIKDLFEIKFPNPNDPNLTLVQETFFKLSFYQLLNNHQQYFHGFSFKSKALEILNFVNLSEEGILEDISVLPSLESAVKELDDMDRQRLKTDFVENKALKNIKINPKQIKSLSKPSLVKEQEISEKQNLKDHSNINKNVMPKIDKFTFFIKYVKLAILYFKKKCDLQQKNDEFVQKGDQTIFSEFFDAYNLSFIKRILIFDNKNLSDKFMQIFNLQNKQNQNKVAELLPFGVVGYHFKEKDKKDFIRKRKRRKKTLFRKEIKYKQKNFD
jgi:hypothetical protein